MSSIFDYQNYRRFLHDFIDYKKKTERDFSHREILRRMNISSTGFLSNIISARNNLTPTQIITCAKALRLTKKESVYFEAIVHFNQVKTIEEKQYFFNRMIKLQKARFKTLKPSQLSLFTKWHYPIIREILYYTPIKDDFKRLAKMVKPPISASEAQEAVEVLEKVGLIQKDNSGVYRHKEGTVTTGDDIQSYYVAQFQLNTIQQAENALQSIRATERDISVVTLKLSDQMFTRIKSEIHIFRKKILQLAEADADQNRVYQCNINFFPVSEKENENEE